MKAVTFHGAKDIQVKEVEDPKLEKKDDIIVRITSTAICGSDLHIYQGAIPTPLFFFHACRAFFVAIIDGKPKNIDRCYSCYHLKKDTGVAYHHENCQQ